MKSEKCMEILEFNDIAELGNFMYELADEQNSVVSSVFFYDKATELIRWLMTYEDITIGSISIENEDYSGYDKEFYITLDSDLVLDVTPAYQYNSSKTSKGYKDIEADLILYDEDVNSRVAIQSKCLNKFEIDFKEDDCSECCICNACHNCQPAENSTTVLRLIDLFDYIF